MQEDLRLGGRSKLSIHPNTAQRRETRSEPTWDAHDLQLGEAIESGGWLGVSASLAIVGLLTIAGLWIEPFVQGPNFAVFYLLAVVFSAMRWGRWAGIVCATSSALLFDYFFVAPYRIFSIGHIWYLITLVGLLTVGLVVSSLVVKAKEEARTARRREAHTALLYSFTESLASGNDLDQILNAVGRHFVEVFRRPIVVLLPDAGTLTVRFRSPELILGERERTAAAWAVENGQEAGCGTDDFSDIGICYRPLRTSQSIVGVIGIRVKHLNELLPPDRSDLLSIFMNQTTLALTRADLAKKAQRAEVLQEAEQFQRALLNSVSHDLRTPLSSVLGVISTILEDRALLDVPTQESLLKTAQDEARRLDWLVQNLLDMTRLEGGAIRMKAEPCDVHEVVAAALHQLGEAGRSRTIAISIPRHLPLIPMDNVLIVQVLVNILDNALKYSAAETRIDIEARLNSGELEIRILDRGRGIPEQQIDRVFDKFYRVAVLGAPKGSGLGLSICKGFVEAHNGRILAKHRPGGGMEFAIFLPTEAKP